MATINHLYILADHIKLSLLERQRASSALAGSLDAEGQDGHIAGSLEQMREAIAHLKGEETRFRNGGEVDKADELADTLPGLEKTLDALTSQFHRFTAPSPPSTSPLPTARHYTPSPQPTTVRFRDTSPTPSNGLFEGAINEPSYRDTVETESMNNPQLQAYHDHILSEQDTHLDSLGESISRQRELSMRIGDELEAQVDMLEETEGLVDRHATRLDRARRSLNRVAEGEGEARGCFIIVILIIVLLLLIVVFK